MAAGDERDTRCLRVITGPTCYFVGINMGLDARFTAIICIEITVRNQKKDNRIYPGRKTDRRIVDQMNGSFASCDGACLLISHRAHIKLHGIEYLIA
jgi:hypothetical protein